jgi:arylsulfatase A-like enzyme
LNRFPQIEKKSRRTYAAMVSSLDDGVGRVLEALHRNGIEKNTLVVFLSDNGGPLKKGRPSFTDNGPLARGKGSLFEGGVRVPFAMQWKGTLPAGRVYTNPVISLDIMATITALAGVEIAAERPLDGVNLIPHLTGQDPQPPHDQLFWRKFENNGISTRKGSMKLVSDERRERDNYQLFDLSADTGEQQDLRGKNPEQVEQLIRDCETWNAGLKARFFPTLGEDEWWKSGGKTQ